MSNELRVSLLDATRHDLEGTIADMVEIHIACSETDGTIATFLPPWDRLKLRKWYKGLSEEPQDRRVIIMVHAASPDESIKLAGFVMLAMPETETGPFRGSVEKLLVSPDFRKR